MNVWIVWQLFDESREVVATYLREEDADALVAECQELYPTHRYDMQKISVLDTFTPTRRVWRISYQDHDPESYSMMSFLGPGPRWTITFMEEASCHDDYPRETDTHPEMMVRIKPGREAEGVNRYSFISNRNTTYSTVIVDNPRNDAMALGVQRIVGYLNHYGIEYVTYDQDVAEQRENDKRFNVRETPFLNQFQRKITVGDYQRVTWGIRDIPSLKIEDGKIVSEGEDEPEEEEEE